MRCEVCGRSIRGQPNRTIIEGAKMLVCSNCAKFSSSTWYPEESRVPFKPVQSLPVKRHLSVPEDRRTRSDLSPDLELVEGFPAIIREARERLGLDHAALGHNIGEKVSVLQKTEAGKLYPDIAFAKKLEHELKVRILSPPREIEYPGDTSLRPQELTFGDMVSIRKKDQRSEQ